MKTKAVYYDKEAEEMYYKGMILKIKKTYALVLTDQNEYMRVKIKGEMHIGQKIMFTDHDIINLKMNRKEEKYMNKKILIAALAVCVTIAVIAGIGFINIDKASALVSLDINPSVDIKISEDNTVLEIIHLNNDAVLITNDDMVGKDIISVLDEMILKAEDVGFLNDSNNNILITAAPLNDDDDLEDIGEAIKDYLYNDAQFAVDVEVIYIESDKDTAEDALEDEVSLGKLEISSISDDDFDDDLTIGEMMDDDDLKLLLSDNIILHDDDDLLEDIYEVLEELKEYADSNPDAAQLIADIEAALSGDIKELEMLLDYADDWLDDYDDDDYDDDDDDDDDDYKLVEELNEVLQELSKYTESSQEAADFIAYANAALLDETTDLKALLDEAKELLDIVEDYDDDDDGDDEDLEELQDALDMLAQYAESNEEVADFIAATELALLGEDADIESLLEEAEDMLDELQDDDSDEDDEDDEDDEEDEEDEEDDD